MPRNLFPHHLFGNYIVEIVKLFMYNFTQFQLTPTAKVTPLQVYYGTPRAAFRYWYKKFNGQMLLPSINFFGADYRRRFDKECPNTNLTMSDPRSYDSADGTVTVNKAPMHFDVTYQFSLFNNTNRERDKMLHRIFQMFPRGQSSLRWYPDPEDFPDIFLFMPLSIDESFSDETEVEGLDQTETRDIIKTNFNIISSAVVPYNIYRVPAVSKVLIDYQVNAIDANGAIIAINNQIGNSINWHDYYTTGETVKIINGADYSLNDFWYYNVKSSGLINIGGNAEII